MTADTPREDTFVAQLAARVVRTPEVLVGIGDDAALARFGDDDVVVAKDVLVDGRHFVVEACGVEAAVHKAVAVNLSDLAAVAARPVAFLVGVVVPTTRAASTMQAVTEGIAAAAEHFGVPCIGGDTNVADAPLTLSVTVLGRCAPDGFVSRDGARVGDVWSVTGPLGGAGAGRHLRPVPRLDAARVLAAAGVPHAMLDLSDGLSTDLPRLCAASGVGALVEGAAVPIHDDVPADDPAQRLAHALHDGEDFELLVAHAPLETAADEALRRAGVHLVQIGTCVEADEGVRIRTAEGVHPLTAGGFDHFA